ncbi:hypothetical protein ACHAWF_005883 [Thalassiosira exigua]
MPTNRRPSSRYERSSFRGLSVIEGERGLEPASNAEDEDRSLFERRNERRRRTSSLAQSSQIRDIIAKTVEELAQKGSGEGSKQRLTAEDRLKSVLKEAKESGCSSERIFGVLGKSGGGSETGEDPIPKSQFVDGLVKLGFRWKDDDELEDIARKFDLNGDGMISLAEFRHFCYHDVPSVAWKAERQRLEKAAGASGSDTAEGAAMDDGRFDVKEIMYAAGPEVHRTSRLFWKQDLNVTISLRYSSDLDVIVMQLQNTDTKESFKTLYINKLDCAVDLEALEEASTLAVQTSDVKTEEGRDVLRKGIHWEFYSNYLVARLQLDKEGNTYIPSLAKLHGDEFDKLDTEKPHNLKAPQNRNERRSGDAGRDAKSLQDEFQMKVRSFRRDSRQARTSRQSAQELSSIVESALNEITLESGG